MRKGQFMGTVPTGTRIDAIAILFKAGFSIENMAEAFAIPSVLIEAELRQSMIRSPQYPTSTTALKSLVAAGLTEDKPTTVAQFLKRKKYKRSEISSAPTVSGGGRCDKHPDAEFNKRGQCKICKRAYMRDWWKNRKKQKPDALDALLQPAKRRGRPAKRRMPEPSPAEQTWEVAIAKDGAQEEAPAPAKPEGAFQYSVVVTCPKCAMARVRLRRRANADLTKDCWLHDRDGLAPCLVKIRNYMIKVDKHYQPPQVAAIA